MDDPWGSSPWDDDLRSTIPSITKGNNGGLALKTLGTKLADGKGETDSPWDDEGGDFGDWAALPTEDEGLGIGGIDGVDERWEERPTRIDGGEAKNDLRGLSPHWSEPAVSPEIGRTTLSPVLFQKPTEATRQPSPDPWATERKETTLNGNGDKKAILDAKDQDTTVNPGSSTTEKVPEKGSADTSQLLNDDAKVSQTGPSMEEENTADDETLATSSVVSRGTPEPIEMPEEYTNGKEIEESSRPSSSPSDHSHHDEMQPESPRTSLDEEPKRPQGHRHVSTKIQELVEHFDGLVMAQLEEPVILHGSGQTSRENLDKETGERDEKENLRGIDIPGGVDDREMDAALRAGASEAALVDKSDPQKDEEDDDFGDFEDGQSEISESFEEEVKQQITEPPTSYLSENQPQEASKEPSPPEIVAPKLQIFKDFGRVEYDVDKLAFDQLYPELKTAPDRSAEKLFIPDVIPYDSFSSVEQRKTWYRLSRYVSMRKHNSGDDENYVRINWLQSQTRVETLKIVARWMEQDRISGRVVLGGGSKDGSLFGWNDPKAAPIPLAAAFDEKRKNKQAPSPATVEAAPEVPREWPKGLVKPRSTSQNRSSSKPRRRSSAKSSRSSEEIKQIVKAPVPNFGWNTDPQVNHTSPGRDTKPAPIPLAEPSPPQKSISPSPPPPASSVPPLKIATEHRKPTGYGLESLQPITEVLTPVSAPNPQKANGLNTLQPTANISMPAFPSISSTQNFSNSFEDDWGEMISSPVVTAAPKLPPPNGLRHKKSRSLIEAKPPPSDVSSFDGTAPSIPADRGHRPTTSLDELLVPKTTPTPSTDTFSSGTMSSTFAPATSANVVAPTSSLAPLANGNFDPWASIDMFSTSTNLPSVAPSTISNVGAPIASIAPSAGNNYDAWASADFSFFESAPTPAPTSASVTKPVSAPALKSAVASKPKAAAKSVAFQPLAPGPQARGNGKTKKEIEEDKIVVSIIKGLPDLSYMLRR